MTSTWRSGRTAPGWSIGVEAFLYATFPVVLWLLVWLDPRRVVRILVASMGVLAALTAAVYVAGWHDKHWTDPWSAYRLLYRTPLTRLPDFEMGVSVALLAMREASPPVGARRAVGFGRLGCGADV